MVIIQISTTTQVKVTIINNSSVLLVIFPLIPLSHLITHHLFLNSSFISRFLFATSPPHCDASQALSSTPISQPSTALFLSSSSNLLLPTLVSTMFYSLSSSFCFILSVFFLSLHHPFHPQPSLTHGFSVPSTPTFLSHRLSVPSSRS